MRLYILEERLEQHVKKNPILKWRKANGLTQQELAYKSNSSVSGILEWEKGRTVPSLRKIEILAGLMGRESLSLDIALRRWHTALRLMKGGCVDC